MSWYEEHLLFFRLLDWQLGPAWNETHVIRFSPKCKSFQVNVPSLFPQNLSRFSGIFMGDKKEDIDLKMKKQPPEIFCEKRSSKKICNFYRKAPVLSLFLTLLLKETPKLVFSYEICEIFKDTYFEKQLWTTTSDNALMKNSKGQSKHCKDQKQLSVGVLMKRCFENMLQIYRRTPMSCNFNKVAKQLYWNHFSTWVFSSRFAAYFQNTFLQEHLRTGASAKMFE